MARLMPWRDQLSKQRRLLQMIDRRQGVTVDDATHKLECTLPTIWRDLGALQQPGFPLYAERAADGDRGVWRVTEDFKLAVCGLRSDLTTIGPAPRRRTAPPRRTAAQTRRL